MTKPSDKRGTLGLELDLSSRSQTPELMDLADSSQERLFSTLEQFGTINRLLTPCRRLMKHYFLSVMKRDRTRHWTLLDLGAGGCDLPIWLAERCRRLGIHLEVTCLDHDPRVVTFAREKCRDFSNFEVVQADALALSDCGQRWDFVFANHFLHHLPDEQIVAALAAIRRTCRRRFVLSDIRRSYSTYLAYTAIAGPCFKNSFAYYDGRLSICKGFTRKECLNFVDRAGLSGCVRVQRAFPSHLALVSVSV